MAEAKSEIGAENHIALGLNIRGRRKMSGIRNSAWRKVLSTIAALARPTA